MNIVKLFFNFFSICLENAIFSFGSMIFLSGNCSGKMSPPEEQKRPMVLNRVEKGQMVGREAAEVIGLYSPQVQRLVTAYLDGGLAHGNRGRKCFIPSRRRSPSGSFVWPRQPIKSSTNSSLRVVVGAGRN